MITTVREYKKRNHEYCFCVNNEIKYYQEVDKPIISRPIYTDLD